MKDTISSKSRSNKYPLDLITIGRASVDIYGQQTGGRLEDMRSFAKYIGGSPTNIAAGSARLGLKSAVITRVGDEPMGRFIREQLIREGVDVRAVQTDPERLTALAVLGIQDQDRFPLIFFRENCADMALCKDDIDPEFIAEAACICATGTHLSHPRTCGAVLKAVTLARANGARTALDIDYRPNLWGLAGHDAGESRYIESHRVTEHLQSTLPLFDLIVGTEEEFCIAGGDNNIIKALRAVRQISDAILVCKRGPMGATIFEAEIGDTLDSGLRGPRFPVEVYNVLGAGDGFMSGLLRGWLKSDGGWPTALKFANACGALAVSRHGCAPAYPSWEELQLFLKRGVKIPAIRQDSMIEQIHWSTNRFGEWPAMRVFAFDHRRQLEAVVDSCGADKNKIGMFKELCLQAAVKVANGRHGYGVLCDSRLGRTALQRASGTGLWIGRPVEWPGSRPVTLEPELGDDMGGLVEWPSSHVVKLLCFYHPNDDEAMKQSQEMLIKRIFAAARRNGLEFLIEIIASNAGDIEDDTLSTIIDRFYALGVYPDWWKLESQSRTSAWKNICAAISKHDPFCRGVVILGLDAPESELIEGFRLAAAHDLIKGFAVGRTIFKDAAAQWFAGKMQDEEAIGLMAARYNALCNAWDDARA